MAGVHADIPATRMALHLDGSTAKWRNVTTASAWTDATSQLTNIQDIQTTTYLSFTADRSHTVEVAVMFPEARDLRGIFWRWAHTASMSASYSLYYSTDTTDGTDGTWTVHTPHGGDASGNVGPPYYRDNIAAITLNNVKGIRLRMLGWSGNSSAGDYRVYVAHVYANRPSTGVDRLAFWHPTLDQALAPAALDFGDIARGAVHGPRQFRLKNISGSQTANGIQVLAEDLAGRGFGTNALEVSADGSSWAATASVGILAPGAISTVKYVRLTLDPALGTQARAGRLYTTTTSWS